MNNIFAMDSSGKTASVYLESGGMPLFDLTLDKGLTHSETLLPLAKEAFSFAGISPADINLWAVTSGPGSFTGLRIGLGLLKGLALPFAAPAAGVSTLEAWAAASGLCGTIISALDARRGEVYWGAFSAGDSLCRLTPDTATSVKEIEKTLHSAKSPVFFVGDGAEICYNTFNSYAGVERPCTENACSVARGAALVALSRHKATPITTPAASIMPQYLRLSQAERQRAKKLSGT